MKYTFICLAVFILIYGCKKEQTLPVNPPATVPTEEIFVQYNIAAGGHYCDKTTVKPLSISAMLFKVKFDSSAIYTSVDPANQYDINKLYGFTEGQDPHVNSARIGWGYSNGKLRLYAYAYNNQQRLSQEISTVNIGETINCAINTDSLNYVFSVNERQVKISRSQAAVNTQRYQLFPYFGGDEVAPHPIRILIKDL
jgi:hypothetical protein